MEKVQQISQKTKILIWNWKYLLKEQGFKLKDLFLQYGDNGLIELFNFIQLVKAIDQHAQQEDIEDIFNDIDIDKNKSINYRELESAFSKVDLDKDSPFSQNFIKQDKQKEQDYYQTMLNKFKSLKEKHMNNQINIIELIQVYSNNQQKIKPDVLFMILEGQNIAFQDQEKYQFYQIFGDEDIQIQDLYDFLQISQKQQENMKKQEQLLKKFKEQQEQLLKENEQRLKNMKIKNNQMEIEQEFVPIRSGLKKKDSIIQNFEDYYQITEILPGIQQFLQIFENHMKKNEQFTDQEFYPGPPSISNDPTDYRYYQKRNQYQWIRSQNLFQGQIYVFQKQESMLTSRIGMGQYIDPKDIVQGSLGDCYFLSAVSSMADNPDRIFNLFITKRHNIFGVYCVKLCHDGEWKAITVDDFFPCYSKYQGPAFSKAKGNELWVLILEKAYAKIYKSYERIESGNSKEAFRDLTGAPTFNIHTQDQQTGNFNDKLYDELMFALQMEKFIVTAGSSEDINNNLQEQMGLVQSHAYSVIGIQNIYHPQLKDTTLVKLRNPWGKKEWKGDFSVNSNLWTNELKEQLGINKQQFREGIFYMTLFDFQKYFSYATICHYRDDYEYNSLRVNSNWRHAKYFRINIKQQGTYYFSIVQKCKRNFPRNSNYQYSNSRMLLAKLLNDQTFKHYDSKQKEGKENIVSAHLTEGTYFLYTKVEWKGDKNQDFVLTNYGPQQVEFEQIDKNIIPGMLEQSLKSKASFQGKLKPYQHNQYCQRAYNFDHKSGFGYIYVTNQSNKFLNTVFNLKQSQGLKIRKPHKNINNIEFNVLPNSDSIVLFTVSNQGYQMQIHEQFGVN